MLFLLLLSFFFATKYLKQLVRLFIWQPWMWPSEKWNDSQVAWPGLDPGPTDFQTPKVVLLLVLSSDHTLLGCTSTYTCVCTSLLLAGLWASLVETPTAPNCRMRSWGLAGLWNTQGTGSSPEPRPHGVRHPVSCGQALAGVAAAWTVVSHWSKDSPGSKASEELPLNSVLGFS